MPFQIVKNNIVSMKTDAIVNAANSELRGGGGVCGAIFQAAGAEEMDAACRAIGHCDTGSAVITPGFRLSPYVIHAVGPVWSGGTHNEAALLRSAYTRSLELASAHHLQSISFPLISSGMYGYPKAEALEVAVRAIRDYLDRQNEDDLLVYLVLADPSIVPADPRLDAYLQRNTPPQRPPYGYSDAAGSSPNLSGMFLEEASAAFHAAPAAAPSEKPHKLTKPARRPKQPEADKEIAVGKISSIFNHRESRKQTSDLDQMIRSADESFAQALLHLIDERGMKDSDVYKRANIDRKLFSKIRSNPQYHPKKMTALALAIALRLSLPETQALLEKAGFTLSNSSKADIIIEYYLQMSCYDIDIINESLFKYDQPLLGSADF
jgi:O-acetyl-ADP-ribose deacetylase (regulator of RNase III)